MRLAVLGLLLASCSSVLIPRVDHVPASDEDLDGLLGSDDHCPDDAEDEDGFRDGDGCADRDDDHDGVADADDLCPCVAEDADGFEDEDGCVDPDDDRDRIVDACDACPRDPEVYNGCADDDGCPDSARIVISESRIAIIESVTFERDSFEVQERSIPILHAIAQTLIANPQLTRVRIVGHADAHEARADRLGQKRAEAVRDWLIAHGVAASRIEVATVGSTRPIVPSAQVALRWRNRRVEFEIVEVDGQAWSAGSPAPPAVTAPAPPPCAPSGWTSGCADGLPEEPVDVCEAARAHEAAP